MTWELLLLIIGIILYRASRPLDLLPRRDRVIDIEIYRKRE
jgi:hypothetical protein